MFSKDSKTYRFFTEHLKMMFEIPESWNSQEDIGQDDAVLRTALSYIAYKEPILKEGVVSCFTKIPRGKSYYYQGARCYPRYGEHDMSRDQTIIALSSLKFNGDMAEIKEIAPNLRFRLSDRFAMTLALWIWLRMICTDSKFWSTIFGIMELIELLPSVLINKLIRPILKYDKEFNMEWYMSIDPTTGLWHNWDDMGWVFDENVDWCNNGYKLYGLNDKRLAESKWLKFLDSVKYPEYAAHLGSWMIYFMKPGFLKKVLQKLMVWNIEKENYLLRMLMGKDVSLKDINSWKPVHGYRWSSRLNGTYYTNLLEGEDSIYNVIDKDILYAVKEKASE